MAWLYRFYALVLLVSILSVVKCELLTISDVTVLLPFPTRDVVVTYPLAVSGGCFSWSTANNRLLRIDLSNDTCGRNVTIVPLPNPSDDKSPRKRESTRVTATEISSGTQVTCEIFFDELARIEIMTTTKAVIQDEHEVVELAAFDFLGNRFSSLLGLSFEWGVQALSFVEKKQPTDRVLKMIPFAGSRVDKEKVIEKLEAKGLHGSLVLLKGVNLGTSLVIANYSRLTHNVTMSVIQPLFLIPSHSLVVLPGTVFNYRLETLLNKARTPISIPSPLYLWSSNAESIVSVNANGEVHAKEIGNAKVTVRMRDMNESYVQGHIAVINDVSLVIEMYSGANEISEKNKLPSNVSWRLILGQQYTLTLSPLTKPLDGDVVDFTHGVVYLIESGLTFGSIVNGTSVVDPLETGQFVVKGIMLRNGVYRFPDPIKTSHAVIVDEPITVKPNDVHMIALINDKHNGQLIAHGGSGEYLWAVEEECAFVNEKEKERASNERRRKPSSQTIVSVDSQGVLTAIAKGNACVRVTDRRNPRNYAIVNVTVHIAEECVIHIATNTSEVFVGDHIRANAFVFTKHSNPGSDELTFGNRIDFCDRLPLEWTVSDRVFSIHNIDPQTESASETFTTPHCGCMDVRGEDIGSALLIVAIKRHTLPLDNVLSGQSRLFSHKPLSLVNKEPPVISLGSSFVIQLRDGPSPWYSDHTLFQAKANSDDTTTTNDILSTVKLVSSVPVAITTTVLCRKIGLQKVSFTTTNKESRENPFPLSSSIEIAYDCQVPVDMEITVIGDSTPSANCGSFGVLFPSSSRQNPNTFSSTLRTFSHRDVSVKLLDHQKRIFANSSSVDIRWETSNKTAIVWSGKSNWSKVLKVSEYVSESDLKIQIAGTYDKEHLNAIGYRKDITFRPFAKDVHVNVVGDLKLAIDKPRLFNHPTDSSHITVIGGTGRFTYDCAEGNLYGYNKIIEFGKVRDREVTVLPLNEGDTKIFVRDECFPDMPFAEISVSVKDLRSISLFFSHSVIELGSKVEAICEMYDTDGIEIDEKWVDVLLPSLFTDGELLKIEQSSHTQCHFIARGNNVGKGSASVIVKRSQGKELTSNSINVEVFPHFNIDPSVVKVLMGADQKLAFNGGPKYAQKRYHIRSNSSAIVLPPISPKESISSLTVSTTGQGIALVSVSLLPIISIEETNAIKAMKRNHFTITSPSSYGESSATLNVVAMKGLRIRSSVGMLKEERNECYGNKVIPSNNEMRLSVEGLGEGEETLIDLSKLMGLRLKWSVSDERVGMLRHIDQRTLSNELVSSSLGIVLRGLSVGSVSVSVSIEDTKSILFTQTYGHMTTSITVNVVPSLAFVGPSVVYLAQGAKYSILTNRDSNTNAHLRYSILSSKFDKERRSYSASMNANVNNEELINLHSSGTVFASNVFSGTAIVSVYDSLEGEDDVPLVLTVRVEKPRQLQLIPSPGFSQLAIGETATLSVVLRDRFGHALNSQNIGEIFVDQIEGENGIVGLAVNSAEQSVTVRGLGNGSVYLRVWIEGQSETLDDYVHIQVGSIISPNSPSVHIGAIVQFSVSDEYQGSIEKGTWMSENPKIFFINAHTGKGEAKSVGSTVVRYIGTSFRSETAVLVSEVETVYIDQHKLEKQNPTIDFVVPLEMRSKNGVLFTVDKAIDHRIGLVCQAKKYNNWVSVSSSGLNCLIHHSLPSISDPFPTSIPIDIFISPRIGQKSVHHIEVPFVPQFVIKTKSNFIYLKQGTTTEVQVFHCNPSFNVRSPSSHISISVSSSPRLPDHARIVSLTPLSGASEGDIDIIFEDKENRFQTVMKGTFNLDHVSEIHSETSQTRTTKVNEGDFIPLSEKEKSSFSIWKFVALIVVVAFLISLFLSQRP